MYRNEQSLFCLSSDINVGGLGGQVRQLSGLALRWGDGEGVCVVVSVTTGILLHSGRYNPGQSAGLTNTRSEVSMLA